MFTDLIKASSYNHKGKIYPLWAFFLILTTLGCGEKDCIIKETRNANGKEIHTLIDKCNNNRIVSEQEFSKGSSDSLVANGFYKDYYGNGKTKSLLYFKRGIQDSIDILYYENGNIQHKRYKSDNHFSGPQYYYDENGKLSSIDFCKEDNTIWFRCKYDNNGNIKDISGPVINIIMDKRTRTYDSLLAGDVLTLINEVPVIPGAKTILNIKLLDNGKILSDNTVSDFTPLYNIKVHGYVERFDKAGNYEYIAAVKFIDSLSNRLIMSDSTTLDINVSPLR